MRMVRIGIVHLDRNYLEIYFDDDRLYLPINPIDCERERQEDGGFHHWDTYIKDPLQPQQNKNLRTDMK